MAEEESGTNLEAIKGIFYFLLLVFIGGFIWFVMEIVYYSQCTTSESVSCAVFYCQKQKDGSSGTKCFNDSTQQGENVPWRYDKSGNLMCQNATYLNYIDKSYNKADYVGQDSALAKVYSAQNQISG